MQTYTQTKHLHITHKNIYFFQERFFFFNFDKIIKFTVCLYVLLGTAHRAKHTLGKCSVLGPPLSLSSLCHLKDIYPIFNVPNQNYVKCIVSLPPEFDYSRSSIIYINAII